MTCAVCDLDWWSGLLGKVVRGKQNYDKLAVHPSVQRTVVLTAVPRTYFQYIDRFIRLWDDEKWLDAVPPGFCCVGIALPKNSPNVAVIFVDTKTFIMPSSVSGSLRESANLLDGCYQ